jgi:regulator of replication initiation timing
LFNDREKRPYESMTKSELIKVIGELEERIESLESSIEDAECNYWEQKEENERISRDLYNHRQREKEEQLYNQFPHVKPLWWD